MSDAMTDIARDQQRDKTFAYFLCCLVLHLEDRADVQKLESLKVAAATCDGIPRGYWGSPTSLSRNLEEWLAKLYVGDDLVWLKVLLTSANILDMDAYRTLKRNMYSALKRLSPFADKIVSTIDYGVDFSHIEGDIKKYINRCVSDLGMCVYDGDKYAIIFDELPIPRIEWLGRYGQDSPYKKDRNKR